MVVVALIAVAIAAGVELFKFNVRPIAAAYQKRAAAHGRLAQQWNERAESDNLNYFMASAIPDNISAWPWPGAKVMPKAYMRKQAAYHEALKEKYERASRQPWNPVSPDPPPP
jgi:hypothetical protein